MKGVMRKVLDYRQLKYSIHSHHGGTIILFLECGHTKRQKACVTIPKRAKCIECAFITGGK